MKKKLLAFSIAVVSLLSLILVSINVFTNTSKAAITADPIFFIPGADSTPDAWDTMYEKLDPLDVHPIVRLYVSPNGTVQRQDIRTTNNGERPFITVAFQNTQYNEDTVYEDADGLNSAIQTYKSQSPFKKADIVAQSNGGNITTRYLEEDPSSMIKNFISAGTPYNYRANDGDPATDLLLGFIAGSSRLYPKLNVINVIGCEPTTLATDGVVSRDSAMSGQNIFLGNVASFKHLYLTGTDALHGNQTSCTEMAQIISNNLNL